MFAGYRDEVEDPTSADDGVFIPQKELLTWWKQLQRKFPSIYGQEVRSSTVAVTRRRTVSFPLFTHMQCLGHSPAPINTLLALV